MPEIPITSKHTPKTWFATDTGKTAKGDWYTEILQNGDIGYVCNVIQAGERPKAEAEANVKAMAAAPELLEAAQQTLTQLENSIHAHGLGGILYGCADRLKAAIEKAS